MLNKQDFVALLAQKGYTKQAASVVVDDFIRTLEEILVSGKAVTFRGFGSFDVRERPARESVDPQTKERIMLPSYRTPKFTAGKLLKRAIKEGFIRE